MKIALWTTTVGALLALAACGGGGNSSSGSASTGSGSSGSGGSSAPTNAQPTDFAQFVNQQIGTEPAFGTAPIDTSMLNTDFEFNYAFTATNFGAGDTLATTTYSAAAACAAAGTTACNPSVSADLNSTLN